jgi:LPXTG-site transpeptidase (sortase) family protein
MNAIFDENSEFLKYLKQNNPNETPVNAGANLDASTGNPANIAGIDLQKELGDELFNQFAQKTNLPIDPKTPVKTTPNPVPSQKQLSPEYVLDLKSHQLKDSANHSEELIPVKKITNQESYQLQNSAEIPTTPAYTAHPQSQTAVQQSTQNPSLKKLDKINKLSSNQSFAAFILDKLKFVFVSGLIFGITFIALNWSAYSILFENWYLNFAGSDIAAPLNSFTGKDASIALLPSSFELVENSDIPKLNIEVTPPGLRVIVPRLRSNVPVITVSEATLVSRDWDALESEIQNALRDGVVHYPGTPFPNESGNVVLTGHSSYYPWDPGRFKDVFAILHQAIVGDEIVLFYDQQKYVYKITDIKKVNPDEVNVLGDSGDDRLTLITCTPIGTNLKRLIVTAKPVD